MRYSDVFVVADLLLVLHWDHGTMARTFHDFVEFGDFLSDLTAAS